MSSFRRIGTGAIILGLLLAGLFWAGGNTIAATEQMNLAQTTPTSPLPTPTPTLAPNQLNCFVASRPDASSMLLAWHIGQPTTGITFAFARAVIISPTLQTDFIENNKLQQPIPAPAAQSLGSSTLYTTTDSGIETGKSYLYRLDVTGKSGGSLGSFTAYSPAPGSAPDNEICDPNRTSPTATPTSTIPPIIFPTSTPTPPHTATPTWTWTPTITPTGTWTPTPLPADTNTPPPTETFTPIPSDTPLPPTETPSPTFTITPTFTPDIQPPTPASNNFDTPPLDQTLPPPDAPPNEPIPEPAPIATPQQFDEPGPDQPAVENPAAAEVQTQLAADDGEAQTTPTGVAVVAAVVAEAEEVLPVYVAVNDFRPLLLPSSRAGLFRYALFGVAGLAFVGALVFLVAGIGVGKD